MPWKSLGTRRKMTRRRTKNDDQRGRLLMKLFHPPGNQHPHLVPIKLEKVGSVLALYGMTNGIMRLEDSTDITCAIICRGWPSWVMGA